MRGAEVRAIPDQPLSIPRRPLEQACVHSAHRAYRRLLDSPGSTNAPEFDVGVRYEAGRLLGHSDPGFRSRTPPFLLRDPFPVERDASLREADYQCLLPTVVLRALRVESPT